jgi:hypothetical protein
MTPASWQRSWIHSPPVRGALFACIALLAAGVASAQAPAAAAAATAPVTHETFATPDAAVQGLLAAASLNDTNRLLAIYGPGSEDLIDSGDPVADKRAQAYFVKAYATKHSLESDGADRKWLNVGKNDWQLPIPLVQKDGRWQWDGAAGAQELIYRRIGRNELGAIAVCNGIVDAQNDYVAANPEKATVKTYAAKLISDPGRRNGLYWEANPGEEESPAGPFLAKAVKQGYSDASEPYHGYYFRALTEQGKNAPGGAKPFIVNGAATGGFAVVAWPANYRSSGVMTFIVGPDGIVYQKDLGDDTEKLAESMTSYDPDSTWTRAEGE